MRAQRARNWPGQCWLLGLGLVLLSGCASTSARIEAALLADGNPAAHARDLEAHYQVRCPDVLDIRIDTHPEHTGLVSVNANGCARLPGDVVLRVDGLTAMEIARQLARHLRVPASAIHVHVAEHKSQHLYLFGEMASAQVVPYRGPETILDLLQRVGGTKPGAALTDVRIVRAHVADGRPPEVFHVDLPAILLERDLSTNVRLEPFDRIHIGQTRRSRLAVHVPPWLKALSQRLSGMSGEPRVP